MGAYLNTHMPTPFSLSVTNSDVPAQPGLKAVAKAQLLGA